MSPNRYRVSDELWEKIVPLLPKQVNTHRFGGGRPRADDRKCMDAIFFVLRTGCQWNALDETGICPSSTAHDRFQEWVAAGVFQKLWAAGLQQYDECQGIDWSWQSMDGTMTKALLGGEKMWAQPHGSGQRRRQTRRSDGSLRRAGRAGFMACWWVVERTHSNRFRRIFTRWEKEAANYLGLLHLVCAVITYRCAGLFG